MSGWHAYSDTVPIFWIGALWLTVLTATHVHEIREDIRLARLRKRRRSMPKPAGRTPAAAGARQPQRRINLPGGPPMHEQPPRIRSTPPNYGPPQMPPPGRHKPPQGIAWRYVVIAGVAGLCVVVTAVALLLAGRGGHKAVSDPTWGPWPSGTSTAPAAATPTPADVTTIGNWGTATDGVKIRVSKLARGHVSDIASGGHPGDPGVIVTVQVMNGGSSRLDLSQIQLSVRLGADGREAEQVFQDGFGGTPSGSLAVGRTSTSTYLFDAKNAAELKKVSVDASPGWDYASVTFEGSA